MFYCGPNYGLCSTLSTPLYWILIQHYCCLTHYS